ncbi:MAG: Crp/Fnr family transcriptional regulator [Bryobacteraceae bacterium]
MKKTRKGKPANKVPYHPYYNVIDFYRRANYDHFTDWFTFMLVTHAPTLSVQVTRRLLAMEGVTRLSHCRRGTALYSEGDRGHGIYFIESGRVKILRRSPEGRDALFAIAEAGEIFGEQSLLREDLRNTIAEILEDAVIHVIPRTGFLEYCRENPEVWEQLLLIFDWRREQVERQIELLLFYEVEERILRWLVDLADSDRVSTGESRTVRLSQKELASVVGSTRETTSSALNQLSRQGLIQLERRRVVIPSVESVRAAINGRRTHVQTA